MMKLEPGWLGRQFSRVEIEVALWPEGMRREAGFDDSRLTVAQRKQAASVLRGRADELDPPAKHGKVKP